MQTHVIKYSRIVQNLETGVGLFISAFTLCFACKLTHPFLNLPYQNQENAFIITSELLVLPSLSFAFLERQAFGWHLETIDFQMPIMRLQGISKSLF